MRKPAEVPTSAKRDWAKDLTLQTTASGDTSRGPTQQGATHTPGPWHVEARAGMAAAHYGKFCIASQYYSRPGVVDGRDQVASGIGGEHAEANARLIAQSPALLAALKALIAETEAADNPGDMGVGSSADVMQKAREVILAVEGSDRP